MSSAAPRAASQPPCDARSAPRTAYHSPSDTPPNAGIPSGPRCAAPRKPSVTAYRLFEFGMKQLQSTGDRGHPCISDFIGVVEPSSQPAALVNRSPGCSTTSDCSDGYSFSTAAAMNGFTVDAAL